MLITGIREIQSVIMSRLHSESVTSSNLTITIIDTVYKVTVNSKTLRKLYNKYS